MRLLKLASRCKPRWRDARTKPLAGHKIRAPQDQSSMNSGFPPRRRSFFRRSRSALRAHILHGWDSAFPSTAQKLSCICVTSSRLASRCRAYANGIGSGVPASSAARRCAISTQSGVAALSESHQKSCIASISAWTLGSGGGTSFRFVLNSRPPRHQRGGDGVAMPVLAARPGGGGGPRNAAVPGGGIGSCAGTVLSPSFGGGLAWGGGMGGFLPGRRRPGGFGRGGRRAAAVVSPWRRHGRLLWGGGGTGAFLGGGGGRGRGSFWRRLWAAAPAPVPGDGGASLAAASSFSPDHQLDQEPAAADAHSSATSRRRSMVVRVRYQTRAAIQTRNVAAWLL